MLFLKLIVTSWLILLLVHRNKFRRLIYRTNDWRINLRPLNGKEIKGLLGNLYPYDSHYVRSRNIYRLYVLLFGMLFLTTQVVGKHDKYTIGFDISDENRDKNGNEKKRNKNNTMKKLEIGDSIPHFKLEDQNGNLFDVSSLLGKKNLVVFFYPKDDTPGCTKEACTFRDQYEDFVDANAEVIGISGQSVESHKNFSDKHGLTYTILSDKGNKVRKQFGVPGNFFGLIPGRVTYVIDKKGRIIHLFNSQTNIAGHVNEALEILKAIN